MKYLWRLHSGWHVCSLPDLLAWMHGHKYSWHIHASQRISKTYMENSCMIKNIILSWPSNKSSQIVFGADTWPLYGNHTFRFDSLPYQGCTLCVVLLIHAYGVIEWSCGASHVLDARNSSIVTFKFEVKSQSPKKTISQKKVGYLSNFTWE